MESDRAKTRAGGGKPTPIVCKPNFTEVLRAEIAAKSPQFPVVERGRGWLLLEGAAPERAYVFERQRLPAALKMKGDSRRGLAESAWNAFAPSLGTGPWTMHAFDPDAGAADSLQKRAKGIGMAFLERLPPRAPGLAPRADPRGGA